MRQAWDDLTILLGSGLRRRRPFVLFGLLAFSIVSMPWWPTPALAAAAVVGIVARQLGVTSVPRALFVWIAFVPLSMLLEQERFALNTPQFTWWWIANAALVSGFLLTSRSKVARVVSVVVFATVAVLVTLMRSEFERGHIGGVLLLLIQVTLFALTAFCILRGRVVVGWLLGLGAVVMGLGAIEPRIMLPITAVQILVLVCVGVLSGAAGQFGDGVAARAREDAAFGRTVRRLQQSPWATSLIVALSTGGLLLVIATHCVYASMRDFAESIGMIDVEMSRDLFAVFLTALFITAPFVGAFLGHVLGRSRLSMHGLAAIAVTGTTFAITHVTVLKITQPMEFDAARVWLYLVGFGGAPAALAAWSGQWRRWRPSPWVIAGGFALATASLELMEELPLLSIPLLVGIGLLYRFTMASSLPWWGAVSAVLIGWLFGVGVRVTLHVDVFNGPSLIIGLSSVVVPWPFIAAARRLGTATAVPKEHPIYVDFGGPRETPEDAVVSPEEPARSGSTSRA